MATGKKSFILYTDLIHTVRKMPAEKAGKLFMHILEYVNDLHPVTDDLLIELTAEPIIQQLKRDLKVWEEKQEQRRQAGHRSAEVRRRLATIVDEPAQPLQPVEVEEPKPKTSKSKRFVEPTLEEVTAFCLERANDVNPHKWLNHYKSKGWMIGKNKMIDWKASVITWENNSDGAYKTNGNSGPSKNAPELESYAEKDYSGRF